MTTMTANHPLVFSLLHELPSSPLNLKLPDRGLDSVEERGKKKKSNYALTNVGFSLLCLRFFGFFGFFFLSFFSLFLTFLSLSLLGASCRSVCLLIS